MTPPPDPTVFVVDDDEPMCEALQWLLESDGLKVRTFHSAEAFLVAYQSDMPGCLVLDVRMRGMSGLDLHKILRERGVSIPVIMITGHGDVPMAVRAVQAGVIDFLEKPVDDKLLLERIHTALRLDQQKRRRAHQLRDLRERLATLTAREREVKDHVVAGKPNKQIAQELGIAEKTVEVHRKRVMHKLGVHSAVELVRLIIEAGKTDG